MYRGVLSSGLGSHWRREVLRTSLWFVPALEVGAAIVLFAATIAVDRSAYHGEFTLPGWVISGSESTSTTSRCSRADSMAADRPAIPAPTTQTSARISWAGSDAGLVTSARLSSVRACGMPSTLNSPGPGWQATTSRRA